MKLFINTIFFGLIIAVGVMVYRTPYSPCDTPITYVIGSVDPRFGLQAEEVTAAAKEAAQIWNDAGGKIFLTPASPSADLTVNFVYDNRSELDSNVNKLQWQVSQESTSLKDQMDSFRADVAAFEQKMADLNAKIQSYNSRGGAPPDIYKDVIREQEQLRSEGDALNSRAKQLNIATRDYNSQVQNLNQNVQEFNQALSQQPEEGLYDGTDKTISIYFVNNKQELVHTLAHEFGHALGMDHVDNPEAIMYPYSTTTTAVTADDKGQLDLVCREIPLPLYWLHLFSDKVMTLLLSPTIQL